MLLMEKAKKEDFRKKIIGNPFYLPLISDLYEKEKTFDGKIYDADYALFTRYWKDGNRAAYEANYYKKREYLNTYATLSYLNPDCKEYLCRLENTIWLICNEFTWCLPPHLGGAEKSIEEYRSQIDLFAAETASALAEICCLLKEQLSKIICKRVHDEIGRRIKQPFSEQIYPWEKSLYNWNAVCSGCIGTALLYEYPANFAHEKDRIVNNMKRFLSGYHDDGVCAESLGYWGYGFGYFVCFADLLREYTRGEVDLLHEEKTHQIAMFQQRMYLNSGKRATFADTETSVTHYYVGLTHFLCHEYNDVRIPVGVGIPKYGSNDNCWHWMLHIRNFFWTDPLLAPYPTEEENYFSHSGFYSCIHDTDGYGFFTKAGENAHPHAHCDIGEFIFVRNGDVIIDDPGSGEYSAKTFGPERNSMITHSSAGHSVPLINGYVQWCEEPAKGKILSADHAVTMEIASAYPPEACLSSLVREFHISKNLYLVDHFLFTTHIREVRERFPSRLMIWIDHDKRVFLNGKAGKYEIMYDRSFFFPELKTEYFTAIYGRMDYINLLDFVCMDPPLSLCAKFCITTQT